MRVRVRRLVYGSLVGLWRRVGGFIESGFVLVSFAERDLHRTDDHAAPEELSTVLRRHASNA